MNNPLVKTAMAFAPAAISSFFEVRDTDIEGKPINDLERIGAIGGGFGLQKGIMTKVTLREAKKRCIDIFINNEAAPQAKTTLKVIENLLSKIKTEYSITIEHEIDVPIGTGFGTSAGGALTAGLALKEALMLPLTLNQIGKIAHFAEIECRTGLGTVSSLASTGGCVLVVEPGAPGICRLDQIPVTPDYMVVAGFTESDAPNKTIISEPKKKQIINSCGKKTLEAILADPTLENFLERSWEFSQKTGFATQKTRHLVKLAKKAGAVNAAQNMIGEAVHALVLKENADQVAEAFKQVLPSEKVLVSKIDFQGVRLVENEAI